MKDATCIMENIGKSSVFGALLTPGTGQDITPSAAPISISPFKNLFLVSRPT